MGLGENGQGSITKRYAYEILKGEKSSQLSFKEFYSEEFRTLYDTWGARAYLYSGAGENTWQPVRKLILQDNSLYLNPQAFKDIGGVYLFSRIEIDNSGELGLKLVGEFSTDSSPYTIYVYE